MAWFVAWVVLIGLTIVLTIWQGWRKMSAALVAWGFTIVVFIGAAVSAVDEVDEDCVDDLLVSDFYTRSEAEDLCGAASGIGATLGVGLIVVIGFMGFIVLSGIWFMTRPTRVGETPPVAAGEAERQEFEFEVATCSDCATAVPEDAKYCPNCGAKFED